MFTVVGKELHPLSYVQLAGFRLHPGPLPEQYRFSMQVPTKKKPAGAGAKAESSSESSEEESSSDEDRKAKGVEGLIEIEVRLLALTIFI